MATTSVALPRPAHADLVLSGLIGFSADSTGAASEGNFWNTLGPPDDTIDRFNLYVTQPNTGIVGPFLNSGNGSGTSISVPLSPGNFQFFIFGTEVRALPFSFAGLNLFFNGNNAMPGISVFAPVDESPSPPVPAFAANNSPLTADLTSLTTPGAGTLAFTAGGLLVRLTGYRFSVPTVEDLDRISPYIDAPDGFADLVGSFTVQVTVVPEPSSIICFGLGMVSLVGYAGWRRVRPAGPRGTPPPCR
jgi:hypothetical protein